MHLVEQREAHVLQDAQTLSEPSTWPPEQLSHTCTIKTHRFKCANRYQNQHVTAATCLIITAICLLSTQPVQKKAGLVEIMTGSLRWLFRSTRQYGRTLDMVSSTSRERAQVRSVRSERPARKKLN
jgi:hypothetical protein